MDSTTHIEYLQRVGPAYKKKFHALGVYTVRDLLFHFPHRYEDLRTITPVKNIRAGNTYCIRGKILEVNTIRSPKKKSFVTNAVVSDTSGSVQITWFGQPYLSSALEKGDVVCMTGKAERKRHIFLSNPSVEKMRDPNQELVHMGRIVPVYPETKGLSSRFIRSLVFPLLRESGNRLFEDTLPPDIRDRYTFSSVRDALREIHFPSSLDHIAPAKKRIVFEEIFCIAVWTIKERYRLSKIKSVAVPLDIELVKDIVSSLPFTLTDAQKKAVWQIIKDMEKPRPMNRLLEGDVGSGKTVVASIAALSVAKAKYQTALLAPTEILAKQHFKTIFDTLKGFNVNVGLLTGKEDKFYSKKLKNDFIEISRTKLLQKIQKEEIDILIGTHAIIQKHVRFGKLALVVVDEQHRFGVQQRSALIKRKERDTESKIPHLLSMTATPIPRTLALTLYGDLDVSLLDHMPKGRKKIMTKVIPPRQRQEAYEHIREQIAQGRQAFVVCPRINKPDTDKTSKNAWSEVKSAKEEYEKLSQDIFPDLTIGLVHGKVPTAERERIMRDFRRERIHILVATSVIEVGIDIPNASVMVIEGAERFGLAQLHQLRGRVGRAEWQSYCMLFTDSSSPATIARLKALLQHDTGFELAERDLEIRGPGDFTGKRQWGIPDFAMKALKDKKLVQEAREEAKRIVEQDPTLSSFPHLKTKVNELSEHIHAE